MVFLVSIPNLVPKIVHRCGKCVAWLTPPNMLIPAPIDKWISQFTRCYHYRWFATVRTHVLPRHHILISNYSDKWLKNIGGGQFPNERCCIVCLICGKKRETNDLMMMLNVRHWPQYIYGDVWARAQIVHKRIRYGDMSWLLSNDSVVLKKIILLHFHTAPARTAFARYIAHKRCMKYVSKITDVMTLLHFNCEHIVCILFCRMSDACECEAIDRGS